MSAVQAGGGKGSGQKPGSTAGGRPASGAKPAPGRSPNGAGKAPTRRPPGTKPGSGPGGKGQGPKGGGKAAASRTSGYRPGVKPPQRFSPSTLAFVAVAVVVVIIVAFVIVKVTGKSTGPSKTVNAPTVIPASPAVLQTLTSVPATTESTVGLPSASTVGPPTVQKGQPALTINGKPGAVFIGGEFCPLCAAERWPIIMAFSKFGTFTGLKETTSSPWDSDPSTATFTFHGATYSSPYVTFDTSEYESNDTTGLGTRTLLEPLTALEKSLWNKYGGTQPGFPFMDIGNKYFVLNPSYDPAVLAGLDQQDIVSKLKHPKDPVTQDIVGAANYLTAAICDTTGQKPASVCSAPIVATAKQAMKG